MVDLFHPTFNSKWVARHQVAIAVTCFTVALLFGLWMIAHGDAIHL